ncbi:MAG: RagB/SusD family nutrient uptake outer membrane protein, partial [Hymenobacter sp.]
MKRFIKTASFILLVAALLGSGACTKLKDTPYTTIVSSQLNATAQTNAALLGAAYTNWRFVLLDWDGLWRAQELSADQEVIPGRPNGWVDGGVYKRIHQHKWSADEGIVVNNWTRTYAGITNCNRLIYQIENGILDVGSTKDAAIAELRALRASYYYILCDIFGNVPLVTKFDLPTGYLPTQSTRQQVYDFIVNELTAAMPLLSTKNDGTTYGKFNKWAAFTLLAKVYLNAGVYTGTPQWQKCIDACDMVMEKI